MQLSTIHAKMLLFCFSFLSISMYGMRFNVQTRLTAGYTQENKNGFLEKEEVRPAIRDTHLSISSDELGHKVNFWDDHGLICSLPISEGVVQPVDFRASSGEVVSGTVWLKQVD